MLNWFSDLFLVWMWLFPFWLYNSTVFFLKSHPLKVPVFHINGLLYKVIGLKKEKLFVFKVVGLWVMLSFFQNWSVFTITVKRKKYFVIEDFLLTCGIWDDQVSDATEGPILLYKWLKKSWIKHFVQSKWAVIFIWKLIFWSTNSLCAMGLLHTVSEHD